MKKICFVLVFFLVVINYQRNISAAVSTKESMIVNNVNNPEEVIEFANGYMYEYDEYIECVINNQAFQIFGRIECFKVDDNNCCFVINNNGVKEIIKIAGHDIIRVDLSENINVNVIEIIDNNVYLFSNIDNFSAIFVYNDKLKLIKNNYYYEDDEITFYNVNYYNDKWYVFGKKRGHSNNSNLENIGNYSDSKTILIILDNKLNVVGVKYFNHYEKDEEVIYSHIEEEMMYYVFRCNSTDYYYQSNLSFDNNIIVKETDNLSDYVLLDNDNNFINFYYQEELIMETSLEKIKLGKYEKIWNIKIEDGKLNIIHSNNQNIYLTEVDEYHIEKIEPIFISYEEGNYDFENDLNGIDEISVKSYFTNVEVYCVTDFTKNVAGEYNVELLIKREYSDNIILSSLVVVRPYVNIFDGGIYRTGMTLKFLGNAVLNGNSINSGHILSNAGEYNLEVSDNVGNMQKYSFWVVDNYYIRTEDNTEYDLAVPLANHASIELKVGDILVTEITVNNQNVKFIQKEDTVTIYLPINESLDIIEYTINTIKSESIEYVVNEKIKVKILKNKPSISIIEDNKDNPTFIINIEDLDQTIKKIEFKFSNESYEKTINYYFDSELVIDDFELDNGLIEVFLCYDLGDNKLHKERIIVLEGEFTEITKLVNVTSSIEAERLQQIVLTFDNNKIKSLSKLAVNSENIAEKYIIKEDYTSIIVSITISLLIIVILVVCLVISKKKKRLKNHQIK